MELNARLLELAKIKGAPTPVLSVYLNTRWTDEHQRERVRIFLKNEIRRAREAGGSQGMDADLSWVQSRGESLIEQAEFPAAQGVALFACQALGLREALPVRVPFENAFVVSDAPFLRPLATLLEETPAALIVFVDGESARLNPLGTDGAAEEVALESEVPGRHRRGGWAQLAQSRYQRHIQDHRGRHFAAVAEALQHLFEANRIERIVLAGEPGTLATFSKQLPQRILKRIVGSVAGARHESASVILGRAADFLARLEPKEEAPAVDEALTRAAKSFNAVAGLEAALEAVGRGAVHRLYLLKRFGESGRVCAYCGALQPGDGPACRVCGKATTRIELGEAMVDRVIAAGGLVEMVEGHDDLARAGGVAALLRYPL